VQVQVGNAQVKLVDKKLIYKLVRTEKHTHTHKRFMALFPGSPGEPVPEQNFWTLWRKGRLYGGWHIDHLAGRYSIRTKQCPPPPSANFFTGRMPFLPPNQQCQSSSVLS